MSLIIEHKKICGLLEDIKGCREERIPVEEIKEGILQEDVTAAFTLPLKEIATLKKQKEKGTIIPIKKRKDCEMKKGITRNKAQIIDIQREKERFLPKGNLFEKGNFLFPKGTKLREEEIPLLKSAGIEEVKVLRKKRITLIFSSKENGEICKEILQSFPVECKILYETFSRDLIEREKEHTDLFLADDIKIRESAVYPLFKEDREEELMGLCMYKGKGVFHLPLRSESFLSSLVWVLDHFFFGEKKERNVQKVLLGEDMKASLCKKQHNLMYIKCERGNLVAYPIKGANLKEEDLLRKKKAVFSMEKRRADFQRGEWIDVLWI